jgi:hypothetical protein
VDEEVEEAVVPVAGARLEAEAEVARLNRVLIPRHSIM